MLILPLTGKITKQNIPLVTIGIILMNCFIFFVLQSGDSRNYQKAYAFYFRSGLAKTEISRYLDYLQARQNHGPMHNQIPKRVNGKNMKVLFVKMQQDSTFIQKLRADRVITSDEEIYPQWKDLRTAYENLLAMVVGIRYGLTPAHQDFVRPVTYMFLHGSFMHLLGNMIFLWLVGCMLELGCGRWFYLVLYLVSGIFSAEFFALIYANSSAPLIGASGAISGLMGAFTVLYGKSKIKVFYSLGFYFNYARITAIVLLPIWIAKELFQLIFGSYTQVAYVAHIGGLIMGAFIGYLNVKIFHFMDETIFDEDPKEQIPRLLEKALDQIGKLDFEHARPILERVLELDPQNRDALTHLFNMDKINAQDDQFHQSASRLLQQLARGNDTHKELYNTYMDYFRSAKHLRLGRDLLFNIATVFSTHGYLREAERILIAFLHKYPGYQRLPTGVLNLARAYMKEGAALKAKKYLTIICKRYPDAPESQIARQFFNG
ncbi:MAG: rhomboid family intramembrane serine protease [Deltaproteobacteria bacterium]|nr:rhomboid family intramembrane serine protease [Deltaproteobacteria bacterium]